MAELSPAAQAVRNAAGRQYAIDGDLQDSIAAALRAAVEQVIPLTKTPWGTTLVPVLTSLESRDRFLAIATELESQ
jgi:hypothetical protein